MFPAFVEKLIPAPSCQRFLRRSQASSPDQPALVLIVDQIERVRSPSLPDLFQELLECHFPLRLHHHLLDQSLVPLQVQLVHLSEGHASRREARRDAERLVQLGPMSFAQRLRLQLRDEDVRLKKGADGVLHELKGGVLPHPARHVARGRQNAVELLSELSRLLSA